MGKSIIIKNKKNGQWEELYPVTTTENVIDKNGKTVEERLDELFQSVNDGKNLVKNAIIDSGGQVLDADGDGIPTFAELAEGIRSVSLKMASDRRYYPCHFTDETEKVFTCEFEVDNLDFQPRQIFCYCSIPLAYDFLRGHKISQIVGTIARGDYCMYGSMLVGRSALGNYILLQITGFEPRPNGFYAHFTCQIKNMEIVTDPPPEFDLKYGMSIDWIVFS